MPVAKISAVSRWLSSPTKSGWIFAAALGAAVGVYWLDNVMPWHYAEWILYVVPLVIAAFSRKTWVLHSNGLICTVLIIAGYFASPKHESHEVELLNRTLGILMLWLTLVLLAAQNRTAREVVRLASFSHLNPNPVLEFDGGGEVVFCNPAAGEVLREMGTEARAFLPKDWEQVLGQLRACPAQAVEREVCVGERCFEARICLASGYEAMRIYGREITANRRAETALRQSEARFSAMFHRNPEGLFLARLDDDRMVDINEAFAAMLGFERQEVIGRTALELEIWLEPAERGKMVEAVRQTGHCRNFEMQFRKKDGQIGYGLISAEACVLGGTAHILGVLNNITERKQAEQALGESDARYRRLYESMRDAIVSVDMTGLIIDCNPVFCSMVGYSLAELTQMTYQDLTPESWHEMEAEILARQTLVRGYSDVYEKEYRIKDGRILPVELRTFVLQNEAGRPTGMWAIVRDITERKQSRAALHALAQRLRHAQDEEQRRIARELHDSTAQRMAAVSMNLGLLEDRIGEQNEGARKLLQECACMVEEASQEVRTISYLLHPPFLEQLGLGPALRAYAEGFAKRSGIAVQVEMTPGLPRFPDDVALALFRVAQEGLGNVYRHSGSPSAWVRLSCGAAGLMLEIEDVGRGIPTPVLAALRGSGHATGVGLASLRERLDLIGGELDISSSPRGTVLSAVVPQTNFGELAGSQEYANVSQTLTP